MTEFSAVWAYTPYMRAVGIDLVVMGVHDRPPLARWARGSIAERLVRQGDAPVLLARSWGAALALEHVVVPLDGSPRAEAALRAVRPLVPAVARDVTLLRVIARPDDYAEAAGYLRGPAESLPRDRVTCRVAQGDPARAIAAAVGRERLVVLTPHWVSGLAAWAMRAVPDRVAHAGVAALLLVYPGPPAPPFAAAARCHPTEHP